jgi:Tol biopolymer transport system component
MSNLKLFFTCVITSFLILVTLFTASCNGSLAGEKPSGLSNRLAFSSEYDENAFHIYTVNPDGTNIQSTSSDNQTNDGVPMWSTDGTRLLFTSNEADNYEIWSMSADGTDRQRLTTRIGMDTFPRQSPDGTKIVFIGTYFEITCEEDRPTVEILVINSNGTNLQRLTTSSKSGNGWNLAPTWSPDGSKILFSTNREMAGAQPILYIMNADGSDQKRLGFIFPLNGTEPDWSPVTNNIVFVKNSNTKSEIWVMDAGSLFPGWTAKKITDNSGNNHSPVWSPDGKQIAFISDIYGNDNVFIMNSDGSDMRRVTFGNYNDNHPSWR